MIFYDDIVNFCLEALYYVFVIIDPSFSSSFSHHPQSQIDPLVSLGPSFLRDLVLALHETLLIFL